MHEACAVRTLWLLWLLGMAVCASGPTIAFCRNAAANATRFGSKAARARMAKHLQVTLGLPPEIRCQIRTTVRVHRPR
jgi:hypothetical protein